MNSIQNTACLIAAYETAAGLPDNERITRTDGTWRPGVTEQQAASLYRQAQALLAPETKLLSTSRESLIDRCGTLCCPGSCPWETRCSLPPQNPMAVLETLPSVAASSSPLTRNAKPAPYRDVFSRWTTSLSTMCWGAMTAAFQRNTTASHTSALCWGNTLSWRSGICVKQRPGGTPYAGSLQFHPRFRKTQCRRWEA